MSQIPDDICGLCYHPKSEAETCSRGDCELRETDKETIDALKEWIEYTKNRATQLDSDAEKLKEDPNACRRLEIKAGCFRSLALEAERIIQRRD